MAVGPGTPIMVAMESTQARRYLGVRLVFAAIWGVDAVLKWLPGFRRAFLGMVHDAGMGQPSWLEPWFHFWYRVCSHDPHTIAVLIALTETAICLSLLLGVLQRLCFVAGTVFALLIWGVGEGFGGPYMNGSSDIGAAVMYAVVFVALTLLVPRDVRIAAPALDNTLVQRWPRLVPLTFRHS